MSVKIRLRRTGKLNAACHRIVVTDSRSPRDGRFIENIGFYDPRHKMEKIDLERVDYWVPRGAQPSETVTAIINRARTGKTMGGTAQTAETAAPASTTAAPASTTAVPASAQAAEVAVPVTTESAQ